MKQTNGAILLLQNAFKGLALRSYLKGIASAVVLTAGLSAGAAQAENINFTEQLSTTLEGAENVTISVNGDDTYTFTNGEVAGDGHSNAAGFAKDITVNAGGTLEANSVTDLYLTGTLTVAQGGKLNLTGNSMIHPDSVNGADSAYDAVLNGEVNLKGGILQANDLTVGASANVVIEGAVTDWGDRTVENKASSFSQLGGGYYKIDGTETAPGETNVYGRVTIGNHGQLLAYDNTEMNLNQGALISFRGTDGFSGVEADSSATLNINGATIRTEDPDGKVTSGIKGNIHAQTVNFSSGAIRITSGNSIDLEGFNSSSNNYTEDTNRSKINVTMTGGTIENGGIFNFNDANIADSTFTATGGTIINSGTMTFNGETNLAGAAVSNSKTLTVNGALTVDTVSDLYNSETAADKAAKLNVSGDLTVEGEDTFDITSSNFNNTGAATGVLTARQSTVTIDKDYATNGFKELTVANLEATKDGEGFTITDGTKVTILEGMTLKAAAAAASARATTYDTITVAGELNFGDDGSAGKKLQLNYSLTGDGSLNVIAGNWEVGDVTVNSTGDLSVSDGSLDTASLTVTSGSANVTGGTLRTDSLSVTASTGSVTVGGTDTANLVVNGIADAGVKGTISVGNLGTLTINEEALATINGTDGSSKWTASGITLSAGSQLAVNSAETEMTVAEATALVNKIASTTTNTIVDLGSTSISGADANGNGYIDDDEANALGSITADNVSSMTRKVADGTKVVNGHFKGIEITTGTSTQTTGTTILDAANGFFAYTAGDEPASANITVSGNNSVLTLQGSGEVGNVTTAGTTGTILNFVDGQDVNTGDLTGFETVNVNSVVSATGVNVTNLNVANSLTVKNQSGDASVQVTALDLDGTLNVDDLKVGTSSAGGTATVAGILNADTITFDATNVSGSMTVTGSVFADSIDISAGTNGLALSVGNATSTGVLEVNTLDVSGGSLKVDSDFDQRAAAVAIKGFDAKGDLGHDITIGGDLLVGRNAMVGVGVDLATLRSVMGKYTNSIGALSEDSVGAALYLNDTYDVATGDNVVIDSTKFGTTLVAGAQRFALGANSALIISDDLTDYLAENASEYAITYADTLTPATDISFGDNSQIIFESGFVDGDTVNLLKDTSGAVDLSTFADDVTIEAAGGLVNGTLNDQGQVVFTYDREAGDTLLTNVSNPVKNLMHEVFGGEIDGQGTGYDFIVDNGANKGGKSVETAARLTTYAGAIQATYMAQQTTTDAIADRMGMADPISGMIASETEKGAGLWFVPVYKNHDSDSFDAQGVDYGADIDLYGMALGADVTTDSGVRVGAMFNVGSGDADGQGVADEVSNDFDYYGLALYAGVSFGDFALVADAGFTQVSNDIEQSAYTGKLTADTDTQAVTVGLRGEYKLATAVMDVLPHVGVRYTNLDMDGYSVNSAEGVVATTDADNMTVFSIPFGVTLSREIVADAWTVKPLFDVTLTANTGDTELDTDTTFTGTDTVLGLSTEVMDDFTYGATLGLDAQYNDALSVGVGVSYVGSDNADEFGVTGNVRYAF